MGCSVYDHVALFSSSGLTMDLEPGDVDVNLFSTLRLSCRVTFTENNQLVSLRWVRADGKPLASFAKVRRQPFQLDLEIPGVRQEDGGRYRCEAANPMTSASVTSQVRVRVEGTQPQLIVEPAGHRFVPDGGSLTVTARVEPPSDKVRFQWYDGNGEEVTGSGGKEGEGGKGKKGRSELTIKPKKESAGTWSVVAILNEGSANETTLRRTFPVVVHPDGEFQRIPPRSLLAIY